MFETGDWIVYGSTGVCQVVGTKPMARGTETELFYVLKPLTDNGTIYTPAEKSKVFMRPVILPEEAEQLISSIPDMQMQSSEGSNARELAERGREALNTHDCATLAEMILSLRAKKAKMAERRKHLGQVDAHFLQRAENLLFGELSIALNIPKESVSDYIDAQLARGNA